MQANDAKAMRRRNLRLALILGSIALAFFVGFMIKMVVLTSPN